LSFTRGSGKGRVRLGSGAAKTRRCAMFLKSAWLTANELAALAALYCSVHNCVDILRTIEEKDGHDVDHSKKTKVVSFREHWFKVVKTNIDEKSFNPKGELRFMVEIEICDGYWDLPEETFGNGGWFAGTKQSLSVEGYLLKMPFSLMKQLLVLTNKFDMEL